MIALKSDTYVYLFMLIYLIYQYIALKKSDTLTYFYVPYNHYKFDIV